MRNVFWLLLILLLLPPLSLWCWLASAPKPPLLEGVAFSPVVLDREGGLLRLGLSADEKYRVRVRLRSPQPTTAPGQFAVFYLGATVLGGGIIEEVLA